MEEQLNEAKRIARAAGAILLKHYNDPPAVHWKSPGDPVTAADHEASDLIVHELELLFPEDGVLSEERTADPARMRRRRIWMVDPMDGTREFVARREEFAVMIGLVSDGVPILGVVYQPTSDKLYSAAHGLGASLELSGQTTPLRVNDATVAAEMSIAVSRSYRSSRVDQISQRLRIEQQIRSGSVGLKVGLICEGRAHLYLHLGNHTHVWDTCGPEAILTEAGGRMTDIFGDRLKYGGQRLQNGHGVVASNGDVHERAVRVTQSVLFGH